MPLLNKKICTKFAVLWIVILCQQKPSIIFIKRILFHFRFINKNLLRLIFLNFFYLFLFIFISLILCLFFSELFINTFIKSLIKIKVRIRHMSLIIIRISFSRKNWWWFHINFWHWQHWFRLLINICDCFQVLSLFSWR